ncbi:PREDICTED: exportin-5-like isoform X1 [Amphimedon queenslandica]|uniref:Importin N-terminal domain-containing protein n=1 Tax=Amphimedon queenslandica TaxID=400682 RepID=A0AAN0IY83_AMPQE|nr:PREDICTED: exportin-5-like isoform X1 [Amphimedon queenslandica]|eukprot:XP_019849729.1 PREDICTED: exportin-5-like isoform X1 [Amphimedon queenslandica]
MFPPSAPPMQLIAAMMAADEWPHAPVGGDVSTHSQSIFLTYTRILDPLTSPQERTEHQKVMEDFRNESPLCIQCGLWLAEQYGEYLGIHLGLQLIEHFVRLRWGSLSTDEQLKLREELMLYINKVGSSDITLPGYLKEGMARVIVELLKKMWPNEWSNFSADVFSVVAKGTQVELILLIFRRLAEDLVSYDSALSNQRKSVMLAALKEPGIVTPLFNLVIAVLEKPDFISLLEVAVSTLTTFSDWVDWKFLTVNNCRIVLLLLSLLLSSNEHRLILCDCLTGIFSRKGALKTSRVHRELLLQVISSDVLSQLQLCINTACEGSMTDNEEYVFLKKLCHMMVQFGVCQLLPLWESTGFTPPEHLQQYLNIMILAFSHPSLLVSSICLEFWNAVVHHQFFKAHPIFLDLLPQLVSRLRDKQFKVGDPTQPLHISSHYSAIDFDGPEEYNIYFSKCKSLVNCLLTDMVQFNPLLFQKECVDAVSLLVAERDFEGVAGDPPSEGIGSKMSPAFLKWDALISFIECWVLGLNQNETLLKEAAPSGVAIIQMLLSFTPTDPTVAFSHLKALDGGLQHFVKFNPEVLLQGYLEKILTYVTFPSTELNKVRLALTREQKQTRLNALYCLINIVKLYAKSLQPATQQLLDHFIALVSSDLLLYSEKCMFIEVFVMLNHFRSSDEQDALLTHLLSEIDALVNGGLKSVVSSLESFIKYLGLDKDITDLTSDFDVKRGQLCYVAHTVMGVLQSSTPRVRRQCGAPDVEGNATSYRHIVPLLIDFVLPLIKVLHQLWSDSSRSFLSAYFQGLHSLHQYDRDAILGIHCSSNREVDELSRIQLQLIMAYDQCVMATGYAWINYGPESLSQVGIVERILNMVFGHLEETAQMRIKVVIRNLLIPMVNSCSPDHWRLSLAPVLSRFCSIAFNSLQKNWSSIRELADNVNEETENGDSLSDQVLLHQLTVNLSKQYIQLISSVCLKKDVSVKEGEDINEDMLDDTSGAKDSKEQKMVDTISDLALSLFTYEEMRRILLLSVFVPLTWLDGYCVRKSINIATAIFEKIPPVQFGESFIYKIMEQLLLGLQTHGEDGGLSVSLITLTLFIYESSAHVFPTLFNLLASLPDCSQDKVKSFNDFIANKKGGMQAKQIKRKKEEFRKLVSGIIGKPVGQLHKNNPVFMDLPSFAVKKDQRLRNPSSYSYDLSSLFCCDDDVS